MREQLGSEQNRNSIFKKKTQPNRKGELNSQKQNFDSEDSERSDVSYESSFNSKEDASIGHIQYFKEEMARFFINFPELANQNILASNQQENNIDHYWNQIAEDVLSQTKQSYLSLQSLAKRISQYRERSEQTNLVDLLLAQKETILADLESQINLKKGELTTKGNEGLWNMLDAAGADSYLSWRKRQEAKFSKNLVSRNTLSKKQSSVPKKQKQFHRSLHKVRFSKEIDKINISKSKLRRASENKVEKLIKEGATKKREELGRGFTECSNYIVPKKHLINFEPRTEAARHICEQIKKYSPSNELGIKKAIIGELTRLQQNLNSEVIEKSLLSQKTQKLYNEDSKELLMLYPGLISKGTGQSSKQKNSDSSHRLLTFLKEVSEGPIVSYWEQLQANKL